MAEGMKRVHLAVVGIALLILTSSAAATGVLDSIDHQVVRVFNTLAAIPSLGAGAYLVTVVGGTLLWLGLAVLCALRPSSGGRRKALLLFLAVATTYLSLEVLKTVTYRPRPWMVIPDLVLSYGVESSSSFPSRSTATAFAGAVGFYGCWRRGRLLGLGVATVVGISRMVLGQHYPTDVLAGGLYGSLVGYGVVGVLLQASDWWNRKLGRGRLHAF